MFILLFEYKYLCVILFVLLNLFNFKLEFLKSISFEFDNLILFDILLLLNNDFFINVDDEPLVKGFFDIFFENLKTSSP